MSELLDTVTCGFSPREQPGGDVVSQVVTHHPLQAFSRRYFLGDARLFSYATDLCDASRGVGSTARQPAPLVTIGLDEPGEEWHTVALGRLLAFFRHPTRYFVQQRLGIFLEEDEGVLETRKPFTLAPLVRYRLRQEVLRQHLAGEPSQSIQRCVRAAGLLPHGQVGSTLFEGEWPSIERFAARLHQVLPAEAHGTLDIDLCLGDWCLTGQLTHVTPQGLVGYHLGKVRSRDYLDLWVRHLVLNCLAPGDVQPQSRWLSEDKELLMRPVTDPHVCLQGLLRWYGQGLRHPLHLFPDSALAYVDARRKQRPDPLSGARTTWEGSEFHRGECEERYYQLAFRHNDPLDEEFVQVTDMIFLPLFAHLEEG